MRPLDPRIIEGLAHLSHTRTHEACQLQQDNEGLSSNANGKYMLVFVDGTRALVVLTERDEFKTSPYHVLYDMLMHPAFLLDGLIVLNPTVLDDIGFKVRAMLLQEAPS